MKNHSNDSGKYKKKMKKKKERKQIQMNAQDDKWILWFVYHFA